MKGSARKENIKKKKKKQCPKVQVRKYSEHKKVTGRARDSKKWGQMKPWE